MNAVEFRGELEELQSLARKTRVRLHLELAELPTDDDDEPPALLEAMAEILAVIAEIERRLTWLLTTGGTE